MDNQQQINLGALPSPRDFRDIQLAKVQAPVPIPDEFIPDYLDKIPKLFQNGLGICSSCAGSYFKEIQEYLESNQPQKFSPRYIWIKTKQIDGVPLEVGSYLRAVLKTLQSNGVCDYDLLPNQFPISLQDYSNPSVIIPEIDDNAQPRIIKSYAFLDDLSFDGLRQAIYQNKVVLARIVVDEGFFGTNEPTFTQKKWGHLVCLCGYTKDEIIILDSTEQDEKYAIKRIKKEYIEQGFLTEAGTGIDIDDEVVRQLIKKRELFQKLYELYRQLLNLWKQLKPAK